MPASKIPDKSHPNLTADEAAAYLRRPKRTLEHWRHVGIGPTYVRAGRQVLYRASDLERWLDANAVRPGA